MSAHPLLEELKPIFSRYLQEGKNVSDESKKNIEMALLVLGDESGIENPLDDFIIRDHLWNLAKLEILNVDIEEGDEPDEHRKAFAVALRSFHERYMKEYEEDYY